MNRHICIHSHFYQPPRENPWLEEVERQESAFPYHDWNDRIAAECYTPNTETPILGPDEKVAKTCNNYEKISFNFGPTLLSWIQRRKPEVYNKIINADKESQTHFDGYGSAIAQVYNHMIMPLANKRDKQTQIIWGMRDFESRFNRKPEGIWLAETAVDTATLEALADHGIKFTILAPRQAKRARKIGDTDWKDVSRENIDTKMPYLCKLPSGREIALFFYNAGISQGIAFGNTLSNGEDFANLLAGSFDKSGNQPQLVSIAVDGETFGHHKRYGNMALAYCIHCIEENNLAEVSTYNSYLANHPPKHEVEIIENSSWSCSHGIERWQSNCPCGSGPSSEWTQEWREPLRNAVDMLRDKLAAIFEEGAGGFINDPWQARNDYIDILLNKTEAEINNFFSKHAAKSLSKEEKLIVLKLLETQKYAMFMHTSCGWFFDDISRIETVQIMRCAARAMQLVTDATGASQEDDFLKILKQAPSNVPDFKTGAGVYEQLVKPTIPENSNIMSLESLIEP